MNQLLHNGKVKLYGADDLRSAVEQATEFQKTQKVFSIEPDVL
jgi:hypothetical protein